MLIKIEHLKKAKPENVIRLARWLKLNIEGLNIEQIINLVYYRFVKDKYNGLWR